MAARGARGHRTKTRNGRQNDRGDAPFYRDLESSEARGSISLSSLTRAADAMDCELVYFLVPRDAVAKTFGELALRHDPAMKHLHASEHSMALEGQAVGDLAPQSPAK